tara:strand:+ start:857 stop:1918 length:1062 start_codon:yes stop_codon:yes gene_type:complete
MTLEKFSKNLSDFVDELNLTFPENPIPNDAYSVITEEHMNTLLLELKPYIYSISQYKSDVFNTEEPFVLLQYIQLSEYWKHNLSQSTRNSLLNYLHILYILAFRSQRVVSTDIDLNSDEPSESELFFTLVKNIRKSKSENNTCCEREKCENETSSALDSILGGGMLGELAKDIAEDIDFEKDLGNPMELMGMLMGGGGENSKAGGNFMNLVQKIGNKVQNKIESGEIDHGQLLNEAQNIMGSLGGGGDAGAMGGLGGLDIGNMAKMFSKMMPGGMPGGMPDEKTIEKRLNNNRDVALLQRKERLRKKLAERKAKELEKTTAVQNGESVGKRKRRRRKKKRKEKVTENVDEVTN